MKPSVLTYIMLCLVLSFSCSNDGSLTEESPNEDTLYFPPIGINIWETSSIPELGWNADAELELLNYLQNTNTKSFIILKNGKIAVEAYFNETTASSNNPWFSAGKTLTAFMVGIAQEEQFLTVSESSSNHLMSGWSNLTPEQENLISIENHLTMTTGLDYTIDFACTDHQCLEYLNEPGFFWYYHNAPYTLIQSVISGAIDTEFDTYFNEKLRDKIGMQGFWFPVGYNNFYLSNARSMARFGLLCLNKGKWDDTIILNDTAYFNAMTSTSQNLNPAYGYLWWLNGKSSYKLPSSVLTYDGKLIPNAPDDLIAGLGANDQKLYVVPSQNLVIIRMGEDPGEGQLGPSGYDNLLWEKINSLIN